MCFAAWMLFAVIGIASRYEQEGADELVFLDITASHEGRDIMIDVVRRTAEQIFMPLTVGGGIRTLEVIRALLNAGASQPGTDRWLAPEIEMAYQLVVDGTVRAAAESAIGPLN